ncbi:MAG: LamG domain-containing protein [Acidobacteriota bacterium]|nr:LamG domain-containing protein [Acidobacteriota bacterium]
MKHRQSLFKIVLMGVLISLLIFPSVGVTFPQHCTPPPSDLVTWWPGDGNANDISGNEQNGTLKGGATFAQGMVDQAFQFDGIEGRVEVPDSTLLRFGTGDVTVDAWFKCDLGSSFRAIVGKEQQSFPYPSIFLRVSDVGRLEFAVTDCGTGACGYSQPGLGGSRQPVESPFRVDDGEFHHVAGVRHSAGYELYVDGQLVATRLEPARNGDNTESLFIGVQAPSSTGSVQFPFQGIIDEVEIIDRALSASEVQALFTAGSAGKCKEATICHKPGTKAQKFLVIPVEALQGHLGHGDTLGQCN